MVADMDASAALSERESRDREIFDRIALQAPTPKKI